MKTWFLILLILVCGFWAHRKYHYVEVWLDEYEEATAPDPPPKDFKIRKWYA